MEFEVDWEFHKLVAELEHAKETIHKLDKSDYRRDTIARYLNGYELETVRLLCLFAYIATDNIIRILKRGYENKIEKWLKAQKELKTQTEEKK